MIGVRAPGSSANLGPGFDVLGLAVTRYVWAFDEPHQRCEPNPCGPEHIARIAYESAGGSEPIWFGFELEPGRGLGFSAAARAAGAVLAFLQQGHDLPEAQRLGYEVVFGLEGHGDNAAPAVFGGIHVIAGDLDHRLAAGLPGRLLCWVPDLETPTDESRSRLTPEVSRADAVHNLGRVGLLMAALYENDGSLLRRATEDRLHQPSRLDCCPPAKRALETALDLGADGAWLSGSGPTVAIVASEESIDTVAAGLPGDGKVLHLDLDSAGAAPWSG
ncbi:MAG: homoserine kinase [Actinomycetota bacterium]